MDAPRSPAPTSAGSPTNPPNGSPQGYPAETGAGEPRVMKRAPSVAQMRARMLDGHREILAAIRDGRKPVDRAGSERGMRTCRRTLLGWGAIRIDESGSPILTSVGAELAGAGEPRVLAVDLALEIATVAYGGTTYRLPIDDDRADAGVIAPMWRRADSAADEALSPHEDALTRDLTAFVREAA